MTQPVPKPGVLGPLPIGLGEILAMVKTAVRFALQLDQLPVAHLIGMNSNSCDGCFHPPRATVRGSTGQEVN